jgi:hypothetical protein
MSDVGDQPWYPIWWPGWSEFEQSVLEGCEIQDWVINPDGTRFLRVQNMAANNELARRNPVDSTDRWGGLSPSGESLPYALAWVDTCTGTDVAVETPGPYVGPYGYGRYGHSIYGGPTP